MRATFGSLPTYQQARLNMEAVRGAALPIRAVPDRDLHPSTSGVFGCQLAVGFLHVRILAEASGVGTRSDVVSVTIR